MTVVLLNPDGGVTTVETDDLHTDFSRTTGFVYWEIDETAGETTYYFQPWARVGRIVSADGTPMYR